MLAIPFFIFLLSISLLVKAVNIKGQDPREYEGSIYIDIALIILDAIYRTILWFLILLICYGWKISIQNLGRKDLKFLMTILLLIYIMTCLDQIIDSASTGICEFHLSEIKNLFFYGWMIFYMLHKIAITFFFLESKLDYARALSLEYIEALVYKKNLIKKFIWMLLIYYGLFTILALIHKLVLYLYDTTLFELYNYSILDIYLSTYFLYLLRPKVLPPNFNVDFGNDIEEDIGIIYKAFLPKYQDVKELKENSKKELSSCKGKLIPILVMGPCLSNYSQGDEANNSINNYIINIKVGYSD